MVRKRLKIHNKALFFFGSAFLAMGLAVCYFTFAKSLVGYFNSTYFEKTPATITSLELKRNFGDTTTYKVNAQYTYQYNGTTYHNDDVSIYTASDNVGTYWQDLYRKLKSDKNQNTAVAYVNPKQPNQSLLNRDFRIGMALFSSLFLFAFCGVGVGIMYFAMKAPKSRGDLIQDAKQGISSNQKSDTILLKVLGVFILVFGGMICALTLPKVISKGEYIALVVLVLPITGFLLTRYSWNKSKTFDAIGQTLLKINPAPGSIGGQIGGHFKVASWRVEDDMLIKLTCYKTVHRGDDTDRHLEWQGKTRGYSKSHGDETVVRFVFDVPKELPETGTSTDWVIDCDGMINIDGQKMRLERSWDVLMENGHHQSNETRYIPAHFTREQTIKNQESAKESAKQQIEIRKLGQDFAIISDPARNLGLCAVLFGVGAIFAIIGYFISSNANILGAIFYGIGGFMALLATYLVGRKLSAVVDVDKNALFVGRSWFNVRLWTRTMTPKGEILFKAKETSRVTSGDEQTVYYAIYAHSAGRTLKVAESIAGRPAADVLIKDLSKLMVK